MKTKPYKHQLETWEKTRDLPYHALFMEQGTGKSKVIIDTADHLFKEGKIDCVLLIGPNGIQQNWHINEIPTHCASDYKSIYWSSLSSIKQKREIVRFLTVDKKLKFFGTNIEALRSFNLNEKLKNLTFSDKDFIMNVEPAILHLLNTQKIMMVVDESTIIKSASALQTKVVLKLSQHPSVKYKRILTGTPITHSPLDLWTQMKFLSLNFWPIPTYTAFKNTFAIEKPMILGPRTFNKIVGYKNLDFLQKLVAPCSTRITKADCLDLPEKIYQTRYVPFKPEQRVVYKSLLDEQMAHFAKEGVIVEATTAIAALNKLQQVLSGFVLDSEGNVISVPSGKYDALREIIENTGDTEKFIVFAKYNVEVAKILETCADLFKGSKSYAVSYYGKNDEKERNHAVLSFQTDPNCRVFVGSSAAARGLTLTAATTVVYFTNDYSLEVRLQSEDRAHRIGQKRNVLYIDLIVPQTVDEKVLQILKSKKSVSEAVLDWKDFFKNAIPHDNEQI